MHCEVNRKRDINALLHRDICSSIPSILERLRNENKSFVVLTSLKPTSLPARPSSVEFMIRDAPVNTYLHEK
jgi:hypothetical protein